MQKNQSRRPVQGGRLSRLSCFAGKFRQGHISSLVSGYIKRAMPFVPRVGETCDKSIESRAHGRLIIRVPVHVVREVVRAVLRTIGRRVPRVTKGKGRQKSGFPICNLHISMPDYFKNKILFLQINKILDFVIDK